MAELIYNEIKAPIGKPHPISMVKLIPAGSGTFDVLVDGVNIYSKHKTGRHADRSEVVAEIKRRLR